MPRPGIASNSSISSSGAIRSAALRTIAWPNGCSEPFSADAAMRSNSSAVYRPNGTTSVREALDRRAGDLRVPHEFDNLIERRIGPHAGRADLQEARLVHRRPNDRVLDALVYRDRLSRDHRLVDRGEPLGDRAVDRNPFPRPDDHDLVHLHELHGHLFLAAVPQDVGGPRREVHQLADRIAGPAPRELLEVLPQEDEADDHRGGVVVGPLVREGDPEEREERDDGAVSPGRRRTEGDQDVHVRAPVLERIPGAVVEAPPRDELDRGREEEDGEVQGFLGPGVPPAHALPAASYYARDTDPETETAWHSW